MKKIVFVIILLLSFIYIPNVYASSDVFIESVRLDSKSDNSEIVNDAIYEGLSVKFDVKFLDVGDFVKYKIIVNNNSNKDYEIYENSSNSEYINYEYSYEDNSNIVEKSSIKIIYIIIKYVKEVPNDKYEKNRYYENNKILLRLNGDNISDNPSTNSSIINIVIIFSLLLFIVLFKNNKIKYFLILLVVLYPICIFALDKIQITIDSKIVIEPNGYFYVYHTSDTSIEKFSIQDYVDGFNIASLVKGNNLYGGYYKDYAYKGSYKGDGVEVDDDIAYDGSEVIFNDNDMCLESGLNFYPKKDTTYYLKERPEAYDVLHIHSGTSSGIIKSIQFFSPYDDYYYRKYGFYVNGEFYFNNIYSSITLNYSNSQYVATTQGVFGLNGYISNSVKGIIPIEQNYSAIIFPVYVTPDYVLVKSRKRFILNLGDLTLDNYNYFIEDNTDELLSVYMSS